MNANTKVVKEAFQRQMVIWNDELQKILEQACKNILYAAIENRRGNPKAHQFTGNLINSIVVLMFRRDTGEIFTFFAYDDLKAPIRKEMSALTSRGTTRKNAIHFRPDWQNTAHSKYTPEVATDGSTGPQDAKSFASSWTPTSKTAFEICVAYTAEYAEWVEMQRQTTGYLNTKRYTKKMMTTIGFKKIA